MAMVLVGAIFVASIETVWAGEVTPPAGKEIRHWKYPQQGEARQFHKGEEMGRFNMGSTVVLLHAANAIEWDPALHAASPIRMGQAIARRC
jgi:phosphatidylserine decarboxylase